MSDIRLIHGDCREVLATLPADSLDACVTDPPAGISFMGKDWDGNKGGRERWIDWMARVMCDVYRVLKPGAHAVVWALPRTSHWTATAVEDAGFEVRDVLMHVFGSGFPKSLDVGKAMDRAAGAEREVVRPRSYELRNGGGYSGGLNTTKPRSESAEISLPATDLARQWQGWGTALKPAAEHWILARKPLVGTVAQNVAKYGTGALNIDGCRVGSGGQLKWAEPRDMGYHGGTDNGPVPATESPLGRWPANVIHDGSEEVLAAFAEYGEKTSGKDCVRGKSGAWSAGDVIHPGLGEAGQPQVWYGDSGSAARFFYTAKASRDERGDGNTHPTVKPLALIDYLVRLVTPPDGTVLDPFLGSGTTALACYRRHFGCVGIEQSADYLAIAESRLAAERQQFALFAEGA
jgi:DNA modification methylase